MIIDDLPCDVLAERSTLGSVILSRDPETLRTAAVIVQPTDFYIERHAWIFEAMVSLLEKHIPVDVSTLSDELRRRERLDEVGGIAYLVELIDVVPTSSFVDHYARIVERTSLMRQLITIGSTIAAAGYDQRDDALAAIGKARELVTIIETKATRNETRYTPGTLDALLKEVFEPINYLVKDILTEGVSLLCGKPKQGKSWLALALALAVAFGGSVLGSIVVEPGDVLYLALEDNKRRLQRRCKKLLSDHGIPSSRFMWQTEWPRLNEGGLTLMEQWLAAHPGARLIVIDTLAKVKPRRNSRKDLYEEDYDDMQGIKALADAHPGLTILIIHHLRKADAEDPLDAITGSTGLVGGVDGALVLVRERGAGDAVLHVVGRDLEEDRELALAWNQPTATWSLLGDAEIYRQSNERIKIIDVLKGSDEPLTIRDVAESLMEPYANVAQLLRRLVNEGLVEQAGRGRYQAKQGGKGTNESNGTPAEEPSQPSGEPYPWETAVPPEWEQPAGPLYGTVLDQVDVTYVCRCLSSAKQDDMNDEFFKGFRTHCTLKRVKPEDVIRALRDAGWRGGPVPPPKPGEAEQE